MRGVPRVARPGTITVHPFNDEGITATRRADGARRLRTQQNAPFQVVTPFWNRFQEQVDVRPALASPVVGPDTCARHVEAYEKVR